MPTYNPGNSSVPTPKGTNISDLKSRLMRPALTSHFQCWFNPPTALLDISKGWLFDKQSAEAGNVYTNDNGELFSLLCSDASLPGSTLSTVDINDDFTGVTEKLAYRRLYDDKADFTFYVDNDYKIILFFENWMQYIVNEQFTPTGFGDKKRPGIAEQNYHYRVNFPNKYRSSIYINKFERDYNNYYGQSELRRYLQYEFMYAYPVSINSIPVSYEASSLLKCTVSFTYSRYIASYKYWSKLKTFSQRQTTTTSAGGQTISADTTGLGGNLNLSGTNALNSSVYNLSAPAYTTSLPNTGTNQTVSGFTVGANANVG